MTDELKKNVNDFIEEYEKSTEKEMSEQEKKIFKDAFEKGINFNKNIGTYL